MNEKAPSFNESKESTDAEKEENWEEIVNEVSKMLSEGKDGAVSLGTMKSGEVLFRSGVDDLDIVLAQVKQHFIKRTQRHSLSVEEIKRN